MATLENGGRARAVRGKPGGAPANGAAEAREDAVAGPARSILRGELENVGLPTLLTIMDMERRSGMLIVQREQQLGRIHVREGRVIRARIEGARKPHGNAAGAEAVYQMLGWSQGQFELWQAQVEGRDEVGEPTTFLLLEGARRSDEARGIDRSGDDVGASVDAW